MKIRGQEFDDELDKVEEEVEEELQPLSVDDLDDDDDDDDGEEERPSRKERRARRGQERRGEREELQSALQKSREEIAELRGRFEQLSSAPPTQQGPGPQDIERMVEERFGQLEEARERAAQHLVSLEGKASETDIRAAKQAYYRTDRELNQFHSQVALARSQPAPPPAHVQKLNEKQSHWAKEHKDVMENDHARALANAELAKMRTSPEWVPSDAEMKKATDVARRVLKLGAEHTDATEHQRRATSGYAAAGAARGAKESPRASTEEQRRMAVDWYDTVVADSDKKKNRSEADKVRLWEKHVLSDSADD